MTNNVEQKVDGQKPAETKAVEKTTLEEITGVGVLVTKIYGTNISTVFIPGTKLKDNKIVSLLVD